MSMGLLVVKTFFKKLIPISFINITSSDFPKEAVDLVKKWYNKP
jgi:hypothetical protein